MELINFWRIVVRRRWVISISFLAFICAALAFLFLVPPTYKAKTKILVDASTAEISLLSAFKFDIDNSIDIDFDTDVALSQIKSDLEYIIEELDIEDRWGRQMSADKIVKSSLLNKLWPQTYIEVEQYEDASILLITAISKNPELSANITNLLAERYIDKRRNLFTDSIKRTRKEVELELINLRETYYSDLEEMKDFLVSVGNVNLDTEVDQLLMKISDLKTLKDENDVTTETLKKTVEATQAKLLELDEFRMDSEELEENNYLNVLKERLALGIAELSRVKAEYTPLHPEYISILNEIEALEGLIREEVSMTTGRKTYERDPLYEDLYILAHTDWVELQLSFIRNDVYDSLITDYQSHLLQFPLKQMTASKIEVRLEYLAEQYGSLIQFRNRLEFLENVTILEYQIVEHAKPPKVIYYPKKKLLFAISIVLGVFWALIFGILFEYTDRTLRSPQDVALFEHLTLLGWFPILKRKELHTELHAQHYPKTRAQQFKAIRTNIELDSESQSSNIITVTSCNRGEGKTVMSAHIARSYSAAGKRTLLIDGNVHAPMLHKLFRLDTDTLELSKKPGDSPTDLIVPAGVQNLDIMPGIDRSGAKDEKIMETGERLSGRIQSAATEYDVVVVDTPAIAESVDALIYNTSMRCYCVLVLQTGNTRYDSIEEFCQKSLGSKVSVGAIVNKVRSCELDAPQRFDDLLELCMRLPIQLIKKAFH